MKKSAELYKVVNAVMNALRQGASVAYVKVGQNTEGGNFTPEDDFRELRLELLSYNTADDDEDVAPTAFRNDNDDCDIWTLFRGNDFISLAVNVEYYVDSYELRDMICEDYDLTAAEITTGMNGYPRDLRGCVLMDGDASDFDAIERMADLYGVSVVELRRKDGWQLWESRGITFDLFDYEQVLSSHDDNVVTFDSFKAYADYLRDFASDFNGETAHDLIEKADEVAEKELGAGEFIHINTYDVTDYETDTRKVSSYYYDTWSYCLAFDCMITD